MLNPTEAALESKAERIARIITKEYGLTVKIEGSLAFINLVNKVIVLPDLTKEEREALQEVLDGFLDHESGHGIFTDVKAFTEAKLKTGTPLHTVWNTIEDYWCEREMGKMYLGCKQNIKKLNDVVLEDLEKKWDEMDPMNRLLFAFGTIWEGRKELKDFLADPFIGGLLPMFIPEIDEGYTINNTGDAIDLARKIMDKIKSVSTEVPVTQVVSAKGECKEGDGEGDSEAKAKPVKVGNEKDESTGTSKGDKDESEESEGSSGDKDEGEGDTEKPEGTETKPVDAKGIEQAKGIQDMFDSGEELENKMDKEKFVNDNLDNIRDRSTYRDPENYLVYSEQYDTEVEYTREQKASYTTKYDKLKAEINDYLGNMATMLSLSLTAETEAYWTGGARRGRKWDRRKLPQWFLGGDDDRLWKQLEQGEQWDTAVSLLWDCSGSMGSNTSKGNKAYLARLAAIAFHEALVRANIPHEVLGFNTGGSPHEELKDKVRRAGDDGIDLSRYSRLDDMDNRYVFVPFGDPDGRALCEIDGGWANRDGECVLWAAKRLAKRPEKRKILIVGSDGQPSGARYGYTEKKYLQVVVRNIINSGIELLALGIMNPSVKKYYPNWALINEATDIPAVVMGELSQQLFRKGMCNVRFPEFHRRPSRGSDF